MIHSGMSPNRGQIKKASGNGFSRLNPSHGDQNRQQSPNKYQLITSQYREWVCKCGPFSFFITLTFPRGTSTRSCCDYTSQLLKMHNKKVFGREYYKKSDFAEGFAFVEDHRDRDVKHIHLLIKQHKKYEKHTFIEHQDLFYSVACKVPKAKGKRTFNTECIDFQAVYRDEGVVDYCFKQIHDKNLCRIKMIGKSGLTDSLDDF